MGIHNLTPWLCDFVFNGIDKIDLKFCSNKTIVIDASIYLYKFQYNGKLVDNFCKLLMLFKYYNIEAIFIFDGTPPDEKKLILEKRRKNKKHAEYKYMELKNTMGDEKISKTEKEIIAKQLEELKTQCIRVRKDDIEIIKTLLQLLGIEYYDAYGEADLLCAQLVNINRAWACMSDDTDLFAYGCKRVLRSLNLNDFTVSLYDLDKILKELNICHDDFVKILVLSGTDYNDTYLDLYKSFEHYQNYKRCESCFDFNFYDYIEKISNSSIVTDALKNIINLFRVPRHLTFVNHYNDTSYQSDKITEFLNSKGYIFPVNI